MNSFDTKEYEIISKHESAPAIFTFRLAGSLGFRPGQFVQVKLPHIGEAPFVPCSDPKEKNFFELSIRGCGSKTNELVKLLPGDTLKIRGPYGNGWPIDKLEARDIILIAGGMGLIPLRPLIFELLRSKTNYGKISLFGGFRTSEHLLFRDDLEKWSKRISLNIYTEQASRDPLCKKGLITEPLLEGKFNVKNSIILICGPEIMLPFVTEVLLDKGIKENQIYLSYERRMECGIGVCQHCNIGKYLVCQDGPVFRFDKISPELNK